MKRALKKILIALCIAASLSTVAYGEELDANMSRAYELDMVYDGLLNKSKKEITRKEFSEMLINFYRKTTGNGGITINIDRFFDTRSVEVNVACELGLMSGVKDKEFDPNGFVKRKDAAVALYKLFKLCNQPVREYSGNKVYFNDISNYNAETKLAINTLRANDIMVGSDNKFHGESDILVYEVAAALVRTYDIAIEVGFKIDGKEIFYGQTVDALIEDFGQPERIDVNEHGYKRYVYNSTDSAKYFMVGVSGGKVKEFFSNATGFSYGDIVSGMDYAKIDFTGFNSVNSYSALISSEFYDMKLIFAHGDNGITLDAIYVCERNNITYNNNYSFTLASSIEKELWEMIGIRRVKNGLAHFNKDAELQSSIKRHCTDVSKSFADGHGMDLSSIERLEKDRIEFTTAVENKFYVRGDSADIYELIMKEVGSRAIISSTTLKNAAIAASAIDSKMYVVIDLYK